MCKHQKEKKCNTYFSFKINTRIGEKKNRLKAKLDKNCKRFIIRLA